MLPAPRFQDAKNNQNFRRLFIMRNSPSVRRLASALVFLLAISTLILVSSLAAFGQATTGTLRGTVTDPNGGGVGGATGTAKKQRNSKTLATKTNGHGGE